MMEAIQKRRLLCVDDDPNILQSFKRNLRKHFDVSVASSGEEGMKMFSEQEPFPVVMSDLRMTHMDGLEFIHQVHEERNDTVCLLLTGQADMESAIAAVNDGFVHRFLQKPFPVSKLVDVLNESFGVYDVQKAENEIIERTLMSSVRVLTEILSMVSPVAFGQTTQIRDCSQALAERLDPSNVWYHELAAMLSQLGCVTIPNIVLLSAYGGQPLSPEDKRLFDSHSRVAGDLLMKIPRLEVVAEIISRQSPGADSPKSKIPLVQLGVKILRTSSAFCNLLGMGLDPSNALGQLSRATPSRDQHIVKALEEIWACQKRFERRSVRVSELHDQMLLDEDVRCAQGTLLVSRHQRVTELMIERLHRFSETKGVKEPILVRIIQ